MMAAGPQTANLANSENFSEIRVDGEAAKCIIINVITTLLETTMSHRDLDQSDTYNMYGEDYADAILDDFDDGYDDEEYYDDDEDDIEGYDPWDYYDPHEDEVWDS